MSRRKHWRRGAVVAALVVAAVAALMVLSSYHMTHRPVPQGYMLAEALRQEGFAAYLRGALPIVDHEPGDAIQVDPKEYDFVKTPSDPSHPQLHTLFENTDATHAIVQALDHNQYDNDYALKLMGDAKNSLKSIPPQQLLERLITADTTLLEKSDDLPASIQTALLLTAQHPAGAAGCMKTPTQTLYVLTLADDNPPGATQYVLELYDFSPDGHELWTGSLEVPRTWTPDRTFALLDGLTGN